MLINGTTGEFPAFSSDERKHTLDVFLKHKGALSVMCHVVANNLPDTLDLRGLGRMYRRPPFIDLADAERQSLREKLRDAGVVS